MKPLICSNPMLRDFEKEFKDAFDNYNRSVDALSARALELDKNVFKIYDFISKVIPAHRSLVLDDNSCDVVRTSDYLELLNDFEYVYNKIKEVL